MLLYRFSKYCQKHIPRKTSILTEALAHAHMFLPVIFHLSIGRRNYWNLENVSVSLILTKHQALKKKEYKKKSAKLNIPIQTIFSVFKLFRRMFSS